MLNVDQGTGEGISILVDHRECHAPYLHFLENVSPQPLVRTTLRAGDIQIGDLVIERKLLPDFYLTLNEGRLYPSQFKLPFLAIPFFEGYIAEPEGGAKNISLLSKKNL